MQQRSAAGHEALPAAPRNAEAAISVGLRSREAAPSGGTDVLELPVTKPHAGDGDADRFAHFVRRDRANESAVTGKAVVALCGKVWVPTRDAKKYPVCPKCKALRDEVGKQGPHWPFAD